MAAKPKPKDDDSGGITSEGKDDKQAADLGERAKGDQQGKRDVHPDGKKDTTEPRGENSSTGSGSA